MNTEDDIIKEFDEKFGTGGFGDTKIYKQCKQFFRQKLQQQKEEIDKKWEERFKIEKETYHRATKTSADYFKKQKEEIIERIEKEKYEIHDLPADNGGKCDLILDHKIQWDGNYYTCSKCGIEFVPASWLNSAITKAIKIIKQI